MNTVQTTAAIVSLANRIDKELKALLEADLKAIRKVQYNIIGTINPEANITQLSIA
ncbi:hypothetical protein GCM10027037_34870 [Mucilaginibacter koreensis]